MLGMITYFVLSMFAWLMVTCVRLWLLGYTPLANSIIIFEGIFKYWEWLAGKMLEIAAPFWIVWLTMTVVVVMTSNMAKQK